MTTGVTTADAARAVLEAVAAGDEGAAWEAAHRLSSLVLESPLVSLALAVREGGALALHRAVQLAEATRGEEREQPTQEVAGGLSWR